VPDFDVTKPSIARVYDYVLGGKDNFAADRAMAEQVVAMVPSIPPTVRENREVVARAVRWAAEAGISQFIDLGCGLPTEPSTHQSAREIVPGARVAYVDNDPVVINHLMAQLGKDQETVVVDGDVADTQAILGKVRGHIDLSRPVCLVIGALLHFYDAEAARDLAGRYTAALAPGSYCAASVLAAAPGPDTDQLISFYSSGTHPAYLHSVADFAGFFGDLDLVPPGVADARTWRPGWESVPDPDPRGTWMYAGMGRKNG